MKECARECCSSNTACGEEECRMWISHEEDYNCILVSIEKHGELTLHQVSERLGISHVRVKQIQEKAVSKLHKRLLVLEG